MAIVDAAGRPIQPKTLRQDQTATIVSLQRSFAGHPVRGLTPAIMASLLEGAEQGDLSSQADLFQDMEERDPHLHAEMAKRRRAILGLPWQIEPPPAATAKEKRQARAVQGLMEAIPDLEDTILDLMDAVGHGFVCCEITWSPGPERLPERIVHRPQSWFQVDRATRQELHLRDQTSDGAALWPMGWIQHRHAARSGYLARSGLYRVLAWPWIMRQFSLRDMAEWLEIYGLPMRLGFYPPGAEAAEKATLYRAVQDLGRHAAGIMPEGMRIELQNAAEGQSDPFMAMVNYCDQVMSKAILGGTLSSTPGATGMGSGVATLQGEVRRDLLVSDARQVQGTLTRDLVWPIAALNGLGDDPRRGPRWVFDTREPGDLTAFSQSLERLVNAGMGQHIPVSWVQEEAGIPVVSAGEPTLAAPVTPLPQAGGGGGGGGRTPQAAPAPDPTAAAAQPRPASAPDYAEAHTAALGTAAQAPLDAWLARIRAEMDTAIAAGEAMPDLAERLLRLYPYLPSADLTGILGEALAASGLAGRYDIAEGA